jgi:hypothetical protein
MEMLQAVACFVAQALFCVFGAGVAAVAGIVLFCLTDNVSRRHTIWTGKKLKLSDNIMTYVHLVRIGIVVFCASSVAWILVCSAFKIACVLC